ncbi:hypothetical protein [Pedobacter agri]|uniref:hypothetical protein n=1 Tax=Pedobacter agri TaxID=454586 RepID=UPI00029A7F14
MFNKKKNNDKEENIMNPENTSENAAENVENTDAEVNETEKAPELSAEENYKQRFNSLTINIYVYMPSSITINVVPKKNVLSFYKLLVKM